MANAPYIWRKIIPTDRKILSDYTSLVGQIVWASNALHAKFMLIFEELLTEERVKINFTMRKTAASIWHSLRSDDLQRTVLKATVIERMRQEAPATKSLLWAITAAGKLTEFRNDAVHTAFVFNKDANKWKMQPNTYAGAPQRVEKLNRVGHAKLFRLLLGDLIQLRIYVDTIYAKLAFEERNTLPKRPLLQSIRLVQQTPPKSSKRQQRGSGRRPRQRPFP